jgi:hypothetical protein
MLVAAHLAGVAGTPDGDDAERHLRPETLTLAFGNRPGPLGQRHAVPVDKSRRQVHTPWVGALPKRLNIPDARGTGAYLRVTRHPDERKVVLSHWRDDVCVASTPVELNELPALIGVLADALGDAAAEPDRDLVGSSTTPSRRSKLRNRLRPALAKVVDLRVRRPLPHEQRDRRTSL